MNSFNFVKVVVHNIDFTVMDSKTKCKQSCLIDRCQSILIVSGKIRETK